MTRYTDEFRAQAVVMLEAAGYPDNKGALVRVAQRLGIKHQTLSRWGRQAQNPPPPEMVQRKSFDLVQALRDEIQSILQEMPNARPDADYRELGTVLGIVVDKLQLIEGKATERIEMMSDDERATRIAEILDAARTRRTDAADEYVQ
jgi:transposase-like protein